MSDTEPDDTTDEEPVSNADDGESFDAGDYGPPPHSPTGEPMKPPFPLGE